MTTTHSTDEYWSVEGVSLNQYGWAVKDIGAGLGVPQHRGENSVLAYRPGQLHRAKIVDSRTIPLGMWVTGTQPELDYNSSSVSNAVIWNENWNTLRQLAFKPNSDQVALTRRWSRLVAGTPTIVSATAQAEFIGTLVPTMTSRDRADFVMEFLLADPFFYGDTVELELAITASGTLVNPGDDEAWHENMTVTMVGPGTNMTLYNYTASSSVRYNATLAAGEVLTLDVGEFTAVSSVHGNVVGSISHTGTRQWMSLKRGSNSLHVGAATSTAGTVTVSFKPPYA